MLFTTKTRQARWRAVASAAVLCALVLSGCGDSGDDKPKASDENVSSGIEEAESRVDALTTGDNSTEPDGDGPAPAADKNVWMINIGLQSAGSARWGSGFEEAAEQLGWDVTIFDGEYTASKWVEGIQQAVAAGADGLVIAAVDCASVKAPLEQARAAGLKVFGLEAADCSDIDAGAEGLFDGAVQYAEGGLKEFAASLGAAQADWVTVATKGEGKIINMTYSESVQNNWQDEGFTTELAEVCPNCEIVETIDIVTTDLYGTAVREKIEQALLKNPDADGLVVPFDDVMTTSGGSAAVNAAGRSAINVAATGGGAPAAFEEIRDGKGIDAIAGSSFEWEAWAAADGLNRLFAGDPVGNSGQATLLIDKGHNDESTTGYENTPVDFRAAYLEAWGLG